MIHIARTVNNPIPEKLVAAAFVRSFTHSQVRCEFIQSENISDGQILVFISPNESLGKIIIDCYKSKNVKIIIFGAMPSSLLKFFQYKYSNWNIIKAGAKSEHARPYSSSESQAKVAYTKLASDFGLSESSRPFERFDFADEWNNMGYGAIRFDGDMWSVSQPVCAPKSNELSCVEIDGDFVISYSSIFNSENSSCIWVNREVGCVDSFEWTMVEHFVASWRPYELPCSPLVAEIPWGYEAAVTMRLDCDEDIESARPLMLAYRDWGVPFSLAITTSNLQNIDNHSIIREVHESGGAILSHTDTHAANWGGSYEAAYDEAFTSSKKIKSIIGTSPKYAVSPFHHSPAYALRALADAGYSGCIGGIIKNDPEFIMARGGYCEGTGRSFVGHTQQVMLHGDCMDNSTSGDDLNVYKSSFDLAVASGSIFGYLDHPFSTRYQYGWSSEAQRIAAHGELIEYIRSRKQNVVFMSENEAMDFLLTKDAIEIIITEGVLKFSFSRPPLTQYEYKVIYKGMSYKISDLEGIHL